MGLFKEYKTNATDEEDGKWNGNFRGGVRVKIRSMQSKAAKAAQDRINKRTAKYHKTGAPVPVAVQKKNEVEMAIAITADWENVDNAAGAIMPFTEEAAKAIYGELWEFRQEVIGYAATADAYRDGEEAEEEKN
jgi:hypothetical protein